MASEIMSQFKGDKTFKVGDVFSNPQLDLGLGSEDPTMKTVYPQARTLTWNLQRIEAIMRADPFFTRALEYRSTQPIVKGIDINSDDIDSERIADFQKEIRKRIDPALKESLFEADAFGWSGCLILIDGHMNAQKLRTPLRPEEITKDKFLGIKPLTRWYQINPEHKMITQLGKKSEIYDPRLLGTPLYYKVAFDGDQGNTYKVHRSRLIITSRNRLSYIEKKVEHYGGTSLLEQAFTSMSNYHTFVQQLHRLLNKSVIPVLKMDDMAASAMVTDKMQEKIDRKISTMRRNIANNNLFVIGDEDSLEFQQAQLGGMAELLKESRKELCAALNTPPEKLFHEKYDDIDYSEYNDFIEERQEFKVKPFYEVVLPMLYKSKYGEDIPKYALSFKPLETPSIKETAEARKTNVEALSIIYKDGALNKKSYQDSLSDIDNNPTDIFRNVDPEYRKWVEQQGVEEGYQSDEIKLAEALNKSGAEYQESKTEGKRQGGDKVDTKKPTPRPKVKQEGGKGD